MKTTETTTQHTPGPWRIGDAGRTIFGPPTGNPSPKTVARLPKVAPPCKVSDLDESVANAFLISTAPELLAALERLYAMGEWQRTITDEMGATVGNAYSAARAAIAKAKGGAL